MEQDEWDVLCVRCAKVQRTCCQTCQVYVTPKDVDRIAQFTGLVDFYHDAPADDPVYLEQDDDPPWRQFVPQPDGTRRILRRRDNGDCWFLGPSGCQLPLDVRPLVCRLYPFQYNYQGLQPQLGQLCPLRLLRPGKSFLEELRMSRTQAEQWHRQLYAKIQEEPQFRSHAQYSAVAR